MPPTTTVISNPPDALKPYETDLIERVRDFGWQTTSVWADEENGDPAFSYTTGFWFSTDQPEVIVFDFPPQLAHDVFGQMMSKTREGIRFPLGVPIGGILANEPVYLVPVKDGAAARYLRSSHWFYRRSPFPVVQLVWADRGGSFPWEEGFDETASTLQPDLSVNGWPPFSSDSGEMKGK